MRRRRGEPWGPDRAWVVRERRPPPTRAPLAAALLLAGCITEPDLPFDDSCDPANEDLSACPTRDPDGGAPADAARTADGAPTPDACVASPEVCNGVDDDCDGETDEAFARLGQGCVVGMGQCRREGRYECRADGRGEECVGEAGEPTAEVCNGVDDDCDGEVDEELANCCDGREEGPPCNGCPAGTLVPHGYVCVPAGEFWMGSPEDEPGRDDDERRHRVRITRPFFMKVTEVTQREWRALMGKNPSLFDECGDDCPVELVNWYEAAAYCNALSRDEGLEPCYVLAGCGDRAPGEDMECEEVRFVGLECEGYRLPTEAEWEYAARAGTETAFYSGPIRHTGCDPLDPNLDAVGWYCGNARGRTHPVGQKRPNAWGLYDVHGNVWEWVNDRYAEDYGGIGDPEVPVVDPLHWAGPGSNRVDRGGAWIRGADSARAAARNSGGAGGRNNLRGFRLARSSP